MRIPHQYGNSNNQARESKLLNRMVEAYFVAAIFDSIAPNEMMKDFQSRDLFGARDIHKKILDIYFLTIREG